MHSVGDKVVYPIHGVGMINEIEKKTILGEEQLYYMIYISTTDMNVMIPVDKSEELGLRSIVSNKDIEKSMKMLMDKSSQMHDDWKVRFNDNKEKIKSGSIFEITEVVRNLYQRNKKKELSSSEKKLYETAYQLLVEEISLKKNKSHENIQNVISEKLEEGQAKLDKLKEKEEKEENKTE